MTHVSFCAVGVQLATPDEALSVPPCAPIRPDTLHHMFGAFAHASLDTRRATPRAGPFGRYWRVG